MLPIQGLAKPHGKTKYSHSTPTRYQIMPEFMENDQYPQGHDERDDGYKESHGNFRYRSDLNGQA
jgi:hypothetical protein